MSFEKRPTGGSWKPWKAPPPVLWAESVVSCSLWGKRSIRVISALELVKYPTGDEIGPQWHISISTKGERPKNVFAILRDFGMSHGEEDNHHPGIARHFWLPIDPAHRADCECKADEVTIVEPDGYRWTNPRDGECRGCQLESMTGRKCPMHATKLAPSDGRLPR